MIAELTDLRLQEMTGADANALWERVRKQRVCFDDFTRDRGEFFAARLIQPTTQGFLYKDDGLILFENVVPKLSAEIHFYIWNPVPEASIVQLGAEACNTMFDRHQLHRVTACPPAFNKLALRIATRTGFKYEGCLRQAFLYEKHYHDVFLYGLLASERRR